MVRITDRTHFAWTEDMLLVGLLAPYAISLGGSGLTLHSPLMSAARFIGSGSDELGLVPFSLSEAMLVGETKEVRLQEPRLISLFEKAQETNEGCLGQLLIDDSGDIAAVSSLLEIVECRKRDAGAMDATFRAVVR